MENAIRHTPAGTRVRAQVAGDNGEVVLVVQDDGPGVPPELRDRIFERFVRGARRSRLLQRPGPRDRARRGRVARRHVSSSRTARPGARFVVRLPAAEPTAREPPAPA